MQQQNYELEIIFVPIFNHFWSNRSGLCVIIGMSNAAWIMQDYNHRDKDEYKSRESLIRAVLMLKNVF